MSAAIICAVDPGSRNIGLVRIHPAGLDLCVIRGAVQPRPSKKNPNPERLNPYLEARAVATEAAAWCIPMARPSPVIGIEAGALSMGGSGSVALAAARQAFFDALATRCGGSEDAARVAAAMLRPVTPNQAKKALTGYGAADKLRMVDSADGLIRKRWRNGIGAWLDLGDKEREAMADALGIALYLEAIPR